MTGDRWTIAGRFIITGANEDEAYLAFRALERAARKAAASTDLCIHASESDPDPDAR